jgi:hypothetical protein
MENISTCVFKGKIIKKILFKINGTWSYIRTFWKSVMPYTRFCVCPLDYDYVLHIVNFAILYLYISFLFKCRNEFHIMPWLPGVRWCHNKENYCFRCLHGEIWPVWLRWTMWPLGLLYSLMNLHIITVIYSWFEINIVDVLFPNKMI